MSSDAKKLLKITGITLLVLVNCAVIFWAAKAIMLSYKVQFCGLIIGIPCTIYTDWINIISNVIYITALFVTVLIALKKSYLVAWLINIVLILVPLAFLLYSLVLF